MSRAVLPPLRANEFSRTLRCKKRKKPEKTSTFLRRACTGLQFDPLRGIHVDAIDVENPVKMRTRGAAGRTGVAKSISALDSCTANDSQSRHVQIHGFEALSVVDSDRVAKNVELFREGHSACRNGPNRFAVGSPLIHSAVIFARGFAIVETPYAKRRCHASGDGCRKWILP